MTDHANVDLVRRGYQAFGSGDMATLDALFADDVVWHVAGRSSMAGDFTGKAAVFGQFGQLMERTGGSFHSTTTTSSATTCTWWRCPRRPRPATGDR